MFHRFYLMPLLVVGFSMIVLFQNCETVKLQEMRRQSLEEKYRQNQNSESHSATDTQPSLVQERAAQ